MKAVKKDIGEALRGARRLDREMTLTCPICAKGDWACGLPTSLWSWRGVPAIQDGSDHSISATKGYLLHLEAIHGVLESDLEWGHLPLVADSPQIRSTQTVWLVNAIIDGLVDKNIIHDSDRREALEICATELMEVVSYNL